MQKLLAALRERPAGTLSESELARASVDLARGLLVRSAAHRSKQERHREQLLSRLMTNPSGQVFTTCLTDRAYRSHDPA
ncbi:MAG: hypothetical protein ABW321_16905, partial [Polyangiales bacterium]